MKRCKRCVMPDTVVGPSSTHGCSFCQSYDTDTDKNKTIPQDDKKLRSLLEHHKKQSKRRARKYDCLLLVSGGKDSLYALYRLVKDYGMNVLAFHYDSVFGDKQARLNLEEAVRILDVDLLVNRNNEMRTRYVRHNILGLLSQPEHSVARLSHLLCVGCMESFLDPAYKIAKKEGIELILTGGGNEDSPVEVDLKWFVKSHNDRYTYLLNSKSKAVLMKYLLHHLLDVLTNPFFWHVSYPRNIAKHLFLKSIINKLFRRKTPIGFYRFVDWNEKEMLSVLEGELGWRRPADRTTTKRFDCKLHLFLDKIRKKNLGVSEKEVINSILVAQNSLCRTDALKKIELEDEEESRIVDQIVKEILKEIGISNYFARVRQLY